MRGRLAGGGCHQGIQAQTISNLYLALEHDLEIIPVLNKIDMAAAMVDEVKDQIVDLGLPQDEILAASGKTGEGVEAVLEAIVERIPAPRGAMTTPLAGPYLRLRVQSVPWHHCLFPRMNGVIKSGDHVKFFNAGSEYDADEIGC